MGQQALSILQRGHVYVNSEYVIEALCMWITDCDYDAPDRYYGLKRSCFLRKSRYYWAKVEIINEVKKYPNQDPMVTLEKFNGRMLNYHFRAKTRESKELFEALYDMSENALDFLTSLLY